MEFEQVYTDNYMLILKYVLKKVNNYSLAEDLTSDIFFKAFKNYDRYDPEKASVKTWLFRITENHLKNYYRDRKVFSDINDESITEGENEDLMLQAALLQEFRDILADAFEYLSEKQRRVIILKYFYNKKSNEIAVTLNTTAGNVRIISKRALERLSDFFKNKKIKPEDYI